MARQHRAARKSGTRTNLYDDITDKIIAELDEGRLPWVQPWGTAAAKAPLAMPRNAATSRQYSGINILILWGAVVQHGYPTQHWLTFRQALSLGGNVRKGERGTTVVYADRFTPEDEKRRAQEARFLIILHCVMIGTKPAIVGQAGGVVQKLAQGKRLVHGYTPYCHDLFQVTIRHGVADVKEHCEENHIGFDRSTFHYKSRRAEQAAVKKRIKEICETPRQFGSFNSECAKKRLTFGGGVWLANGIDEQRGCRVTQTRSPCRLTFFRRPCPCAPRGVLLSSLLPKIAAVNGGP